MPFGTGDLLQSLQQGVVAINNISATITAAQSSSSSGGSTVTTPTTFFNTRTAAIAATIPTAVQGLQTAGYTTAGDGGGALYNKVVSLVTGGFQSTDGAFWALAQQILDPRMLGCVIDGSTDNTTNLQNAVNVAAANYGELRIPSTVAAGGLAFTGTITLSSAMTISGSGDFNARLLGTGGATQTMFNVTSNDPVHFRDLWFDTNTANKTGGTAIAFHGSGGSPENDFTTVERCRFSNHFSCLDFEVAAYWSVRNCIFQLFSNASGTTPITVRNSASGDAGDAEIVGCWFFGGFSTTTYVNWQSSGGLRVTRNKFLGNGTANVFLNINAQGTTGTGLLSMVDNSFDAPAAVAISITTASSVEFITNCSIVGNRFDGSPSNPWIFINKFAGSTIGAINISSNNFVGPASTGIQVAVGDTVLVNSNIFGAVTAAVVLNSVGAATIVGNLLGGGTTTPSSTTGTVLVANNF